jgi:YgiT-type zinc finger domain-containing protein
VGNAADAAEKETVKTVRTMKKARLCSECRQARMEFRVSAMEFEEDGIHVKVSGVRAMVCPNCGATSFPPGVMDEILKTVNAVFEAAKKADMKKSHIKECVLSLA